MDAAKVPANHTPWWQGLLPVTPTLSPGRERGAGDMVIHGGLAAATGETCVGSLCPLVWEAESPQRQQRRTR